MKFQLLHGAVKGTTVVSLNTVTHAVHIRLLARQIHNARILPTGAATRPARLLTDRYGEPEGGSEWEPIKILLGGDGNSNKMNAASNTLLQLTTQVGQTHVATGVPLDLGTNTQPSDLRTQRNTKPRVYRPTPVRPVNTIGHIGPCW
jgi:hypothetical protein